MIKFVFSKFASPFSKIVEKEILLILRNSAQVSVLEIGPGPSEEWISYLKKFPKKIRLTLFDATPDLIHKDGSLNSNLDVIKGIAPQDLSDIETNTFDLVICKNVIEHMPKDVGYNLLYEIDRIARFASIIFTPNGFVWQPPSQNAPFNAHLSGWSTSELKDLESNKVISRKVFDSFPPRVEYSITDHGKSLGLLVEEVYKWGQLHRKIVIGG